MQCRECDEINFTLSNYSYEKSYCIPKDNSSSYYLSEQLKWYVTDYNNSEHYKIFDFEIFNDKKYENNDFILTFKCPEEKPYIIYSIRQCVSKCSNHEDLIEYGLFFNKPLYIYGNICYDKCPYGSIPDNSTMSCIEKNRYTYEDLIIKQEFDDFYQENVDFYFRQYVNENQILYYNVDNLIDKENIDDLICPICFFILKDPLSCSDKINSHSFCKECLDKYLKINNKCPICKSNFKFKKNDKILKELNKLVFLCMFKNEGCNDIFSYSEYLNHIKDCEYNNTKYECKIMKYNYEKKEFGKCGYLGNKKEIVNHCNLCAYNIFNCLFCNEKISQMDLEEHAKEKCKFGIFNYPSGNKYVGGKNKNLKEGYGKFYFLNGNRYEGEFKNNLREGYGILYFSDGDRYEGEFKNGEFNGYGVYYYADGRKYEGQFKNDMKEGIGKLLFVDKGTFEGDWKDNKYNGFGIDTFPSGSKYEGETKNHCYDGFGTYYYPDGNKYDKYEGFWKYHMKEGFGIYHFSNGNKYKGQWKKNFYDGYGIYYFSNGNRYEGEFKNDLKEGYGIFYFSDGRVYEGEWKNGKLNGNGLEFVSGKKVYQGEFRNNKKNGLGIEWKNDECKYIGEWENNKYNGYGIKIKSGKIIYEGKFENNKKC